MGHLLKIKCVDSRVNAHILASTKSPIYTVQVPNLALIHTKRITVCMHLIACFLCVGHSFAMSPICYFFFKDVWILSHRQETLSRNVFIVLLSLFIARRRPIKYKMRMEARSLVYCVRYRKNVYKRLAYLKIPTECVVHHWLVDRELLLQGLTDTSTEMVRERSTPLIFVQVR